MADNIEPLQTRYGLGVRHIQMVLLFFCMAIVYISRVNLSIAILGMTGSEYAANAPVFNWNERVKGTILSSFFWGYLVSNIPAAILTHKYNNKVLLSIVMSSTILICVLTPVVVIQLGSSYLIALRVVLGLFQGFLMPNMHSLLSKWIPPAERARAGGLVLGGSYFGIALVMVVSGYILSSSVGWPLIFYLSGALGVCWLIAWLLLGADSPDSHKNISEKEKRYITSSIVGRTVIQIKPKIPWKSILTSIPLWGILFAQIGSNWGFWTMLTEIPSFINKALDFDIKSDGLLSALPYFAMWIASFPLSILADKLIIMRVMSLQTSRKIWNNMGQTVTGILIIIMPFAAEYGSATAAIAIYTVATIFNTCALFGYNINHIDISPNFACILMGLTNSAANIASITGPLLAGFIIHDEKNIEDWRGIFIVSGCFYITGSVIFTIFGSGDVQPWNMPKEETDYKAKPIETKLNLGKPADYADSIITDVKLPHEKIHL